MDMDLMTTIMVVAIMLMAFMPVMLLLLQWLLKRRSTLNPTPIDVHEMLLHKYKKSGKRNLRRLRCRRLFCTGDNSHPGFQYGALYGINPMTECHCSIVYNGRKHLSRTSMALHPMELTGDTLSENLTVNCRGFVFRSNFLVPIWPDEIFEPDTKRYRKTTKADKERWEGIIERTYAFIVTNEKVHQLHEENVNAIIESINAKAQATSIYQRDEHPRNASGGEIAKSEEDVSTI